jgi:hypothetical protein
MIILSSFDVLQKGLTLRAWNINSSNVHTYTRAPVTMRTDTRTHTHTHTRTHACAHKHTHTCTHTCTHTSTHTHIHEHTPTCHPLSCARLAYRVVVSLLLYGFAKVLTPQGPLFRGGGSPALCTHMHTKFNTVVKERKKER